MADKANLGHTHEAEQITGLDPVAVTGYITAGKKAETILGERATAEGYNTTASGVRSHTEGTDTIASGRNSHAEGANGEANGNCSHVEGGFSAEGKNVAYGYASHAEGVNTTAGDPSQDANAVWCAHAEGENTVASGKSSHAEGNSSTASGNYSHAEGSETTASGVHSHAEGYNTTASNFYTHAEGSETKAIGITSHAEGGGGEAHGNSSHVEGGYFTGGKKGAAYGYASHAEGMSTTAGDPAWAANVAGAAHAEGAATVAKGPFSHAGGYYTIANEDQYAIGTYNVESAGGLGTTGDRFIIGNGTSTGRSNAFRVTSAGKPYAKSTLSTTGADYAEFWEWLDGNPDGEDRRGRLVTLDGEKIRLATAADDFLLGVISGRPAVLGNNYDDEWNGRFLQDVFGNYIMSQYEKAAEFDEDGEQISPAVLYDWYTPNPDYDPSEPYIPREKRKEWAMVGIMGQLILTDDGTCQPNGYCLPGTDGIATATTDKRGYRVMARKDEDHVLAYVHGRVQL